MGCPCFRTRFTLTKQQPPLHRPEFAAEQAPLTGIWQAGTELWPCGWGPRQTRCNRTRTSTKSTVARHLVCGAPQITVASSKLRRSATTSTLHSRLCAAGGRPQAAADSTGLRAGGATHIRSRVVDHGAAEHGDAAARSPVDAHALHSACARPPEEGVPGRRWHASDHGWIAAPESLILPSSNR